MPDFNSTLINKWLIAIGLMIIVGFVMLFVYWLIHKYIYKSKLTWRHALTVFVIYLAVAFGGLAIYLSNPVQNHIQSNRQIHNEKVVKQKIKHDTTSNEQIKNMVMRNAAKGFEKQGMVAIPNRHILMPIYNDAYSTEGLNIGADYANRTTADPQGKNIPVMGQSNYGLAAHNFNDGVTGFSALQQYRNDSKGYVSNGQYIDNNWLNGKDILLANDKGIFVYKITTQHVVDKTNVDVLNPTDKPEVTIISCLFPNTNYRIITKGQMVKSYDWNKAPKKYSQKFNLKLQNTNARADWFNPGVEEGANGDMGGTKK